MKRPHALTIFTVVVSSTLAVVPDAYWLSFPSSPAHAAQSSSLDRNAKAVQDHPQKDQEKGPSEAPKFTKAQITKVQKALRRYDYYDGPLDGKLGPELRQAIKEFQDDEGLDVTGDLDEETYKRILMLLEDESGEEPPNGRLAPDQVLMVSIAKMTPIRHTVGP